MTIPPTGNEAERLAALRDYHVLDTAPERAYDDIAGLAALICQCPIALVSLVDERRQWFKARFGLSMAESPRAFAFCAHALRRKDLLIVPDAAADSRFATNPLVTGEPNIRFYAGAPLTTPSGLTLGTLCVLDRVPRALTALEREVLRALARQVMTQLELRRRLLPPSRIDEEDMTQPDSPHDAAATSPAPGPMPGAGETVLLVEDEPCVRALAHRLLQGAGYSVLSAADGPAALQVAAAHPGRIDLLLTDVTMPDMLGTELAARLRDTDPGLRVLFVSGHLDNRVFQGARGEEHFLAKPFTISSFLHKVREVLDARP